MKPIPYTRFIKGESTNPTADYDACTIRYRNAIRKYYTSVVCTYISKGLIDPATHILDVDL